MLSSSQTQSANTERRKVWNYLLKGDTLYICQGGEIVPNCPKAGQNLKRMKAQVVIMSDNDTLSIVQLRQLLKINK